MIRIITYVLDDDVDELELLQPYLEKIYDCNFQMYTDIKEFIHAIEDGCHIAIIDFQINAGIDGIDVGGMVLQKNPLCYLILYTGNESRQTIVRAMNTGFRYCVNKNAADAKEQVANVVGMQIPGIKMRIEIFQKHFKHLNQHEHAL